MGETNLSGFIWKASVTCLGVVWGYVGVFGGRRLEYVERLFDSLGRAFGRQHLVKHLRNSLHAIPWNWLRTISIVTLLSNPVLTCQHYFRFLQIACIVAMLCGTTFCSDAVLCSNRSHIAACNAIYRLTYVLHICVPIWLFSIQVCGMAYLYTYLGSSIEANVFLI